MPKSAAPEALPFLPESAARVVSAASTTASAAAGALPAPDPQTISHLVLGVTRGVAAGLFAGIPQVLFAQLAGLALGLRERADIGPRFVARAARHTGRDLSHPMRWLLATIFHFEYAAAWGIAYAAGAEAAGPRRLPPWLGGAVLGGVVYTAAFSPFGGATQTGTERPMHRRTWRDTVLHGVAAGSFAFTTAYTYRWLRERW